MCAICVYLYILGYIEVGRLVWTAGPSCWLADWVAELAWPSVGSAAEPMRWSAETLAEPVRWLAGLLAALG